MSLIFNTNADSINNLPVDDNAVPNNELQIANALFKEKQFALTKVVSASKDIVLVMALYLIFCMPQIDNLIKRFFPSTESSIYFFYGIKALLFGFCYFILQNIHAVYKK